ncbi:hypothetical protein [Winogradskyella sp. Asnod2-B02-A]|uniref:hypothetical protein n=1 Tax=Winogradskyella sp. Asnod2-B02-A TaxID=3160583 RepID=UPI00386884D2
MLYYQLNIDYIIETYCINTDKPELKCNGKCHLAKQLTAVNNTDDSGKALVSIYDSFFPVFSEKLPVIEINALTTFYNKQKIIACIQCYSYKFEYYHFKPPIS